MSGNEDDVVSWQLGRDLTDLVRGARWVAVAEPARAKPATNPAPHPAKPRSPKGIQLDENGIPIDR